MVHAAALRSTGNTARVSSPVCCNLHALCWLLRSTCTSTPESVDCHLQLLVLAKGACTWTGHRLGERCAGFHRDVCCLHMDLRTPAGMYKSFGHHLCTFG